MGQKNPLSSPFSPLFPLLRFPYSVCVLVHYCFMCVVFTPFGSKAQHSCISRFRFGHVWHQQLRWIFWQPFSASAASRFARGSLHRFHHWCSRFLFHLLPVLHVSHSFFVPFHGWFTGAFCGEAMAQACISEGASAQLATCITLDAFQQCP